MIRWWANIIIKLTMPITTCCRLCNIKQTSKQIFFKGNKITFRGVETCKLCGRHHICNSWHRSCYWHCLWHLQERGIQWIEYYSLWYLLSVVPLTSSREGYSMNTILGYNWLLPSPSAYYAHTQYQMFVITNSYECFL